MKKFNYQKKNKIKSIKVAILKNKMIQKNRMMRRLNLICLNKLKIIITITHHLTAIWF